MIFECELVLIENFSDYSAVEAILFEFEMHVDHGVCNGDIIRHNNMSYSIVGRIHDDSGIEKYALEKKRFRDSIEFYKNLYALKCRFGLRKFCANKREPKRFYTIYRLFRRIVKEEKESNCTFQLSESRYKQLKAFSSVFGVEFDEHIGDTLDLMELMHDLDSQLAGDVVVSDDFEKYEELYNSFIS